MIDLIIYEVLIIKLIKAVEKEIILGILQLNPILCIHFLHFI